MGNPYDNWRLLVCPGDQGTGTLSTAEVESTLEPGGWAIWSDQDMYLEIQAATGGTMTATPTAWPAREVYIASVGLGKNKYLYTKRIDTSGTFYANKISHPVEQ